jgi:phosphatidylinositol glycan class B
MSRLPQPTTTNVESVQDLITLGLEGPVRSYTSILPTLAFYQLVKYLGIDSTWMISKGPVLLNAILVAAPTDWAVWYMARWIPQERRSRGGSLAWWSAYCSLTSWFNGYALVRTYSNSFETALLAISVALVSRVRQ